MYYKTALFVNEYCESIALKMCANKLEAIRYQENN